MKILIYTHEFPPFLGGLATTSYNLATGLSLKDDTVVSVLAPSYGLNDREVDDKLNLKVSRIPLITNNFIKLIPFLYYLIALLYLYIFMKKSKPDVVLFITEEAEVVGGLLSYLYNFKPIPRVAGSGITTCFYGNKIGKKILKYPISRLYAISDIVVAVSKYSKSLLNSIDVTNNKIKIIHNGVSKNILCDPPDYSKTKRLKEKYSIGNNDKILVTIARILPRKGQDNVIRALNLVNKKFVDFKYIMVGNGRYLNDFKRLANSLGLANKVVFTGGVNHEEIVNYLDLCDVFILANRFWNNKVEGLPNAVLEASARAKPVIVGNHSGSVEAVLDSKTGFLVDSNNIEEISELILKLFLNPDIAKKLGENGRDMILEKFTQNAMIENYYRLLSHIVSAYR